MPGESQAQRSLVGCHLLGRTESDTTEATWWQQLGPADPQLVGSLQGLRHPWGCISCLGVDALLSIPAWPVSGLLVFSHLPWFVIAQVVLQTLEIVPCDEREGECVLESLVSWRFQVEAVAGFLLAHFVMLGVTFSHYSFIYWALSKSQILCSLCI